MFIVEAAKQTMEKSSIQSTTKPVRGGTDGSKISYLGIPTPNIFTGGENMHGRFELVSLQAVKKATNVTIEIAELDIK